MNLNRNNLITSFYEFWGGAINPRRDWIILIFVGTVVCLLIILSNFFLYQDINSQELYVDISKEEIIIKKVNEQKLLKAISFFEERETLLDNVGVKKNIDPSL